MASEAEVLTSSEPVRRPKAFDRPFAALDGFMPLADVQALRAAAEAHFQEPYKHKAETHFLWDYWYVPGLYTYLRAQPERVLGAERVINFHETLKRWAVENLGLGHVTWPMLSLYVDGCGQGIHNDATNGRFGYVFSLTRDDRQSRGGETIVWKEGDPFRTRMDRADAGQGLYDLIPPVFNRLVLFDDRMPHGVQRIEGNMDPMHGRLVLHGHISEGPIVIRGPLSPQDVQATLLPALAGVFDAFGEAQDLHHGPLTLRLEVAADGAVRGCRVLVNRVARSDGGDPDPFVARIVQTAEGLRFPAAEGTTMVTFPIMAGGVLPNIEQQIRDQARIG